MRILVTGLNGFTGRYLQSELEAHGHAVVGMQADITESKALASEIARINPEAVIHLAAISFVGHGDANAFYQVNLIGTRNLLEALSKNAPNVRSVLLASSANVYGNRSEGVLSEKTAPAPVNDYGVSKFAMENMAQTWADKLPIFIVRPFNYSGIGQENKFIIPKIVSNFQNHNKVIELGNIDVSRDFSDVRSVSVAYRKLIEVSPTGKTINICSGKAHSLREVIELCEKITGHNIKVKINPDFIRANEVRVLIGDNSLLKHLVNDWQPRNLEDTLRWMLKEDDLA